VISDLREASGTQFRIDKDGYLGCTIVGFSFSNIQPECQNTKLCRSHLAEDIEKQDEKLNLKYGSCLLISYLTGSFQIKP